MHLKHRLNRFGSFVLANKRLYLKYLLLSLAIVAPLFSIQVVLVLKHFEPIFLLVPTLVTITLGTMMGTMAAQYASNKHLNQSLKDKTAAELKFRQLFEMNQDALMTLAPPSWQFVGANPATLKLFGIQDLATFLRAHPGQLSPEMQPDGTASFEKAGAMIQLALNQGSHTFEWMHCRMDGTPFPATVMLSQLQVNDSIHLLASVRDISEQKHHEAEIKTALAKANSASQAKSDFLNNLSHEIRTPMNGIIGLSDLLQTTLLNTEQRDYVTAISESADGLMSIFNDMLTFSQLEANTMNVTRLPFSLRSLLQQTIKTFEARAMQKGMSLQLHIRQELPDSIIGDAAQLRQIMLHLVGNALKFTLQGQVTIAADFVNRDPNNTHFYIEVADTGIGIPEHKLALIFDAFTQVDSGSSRAYGGSGLGLAICHKLTKLMKGSIQVTSVLGHGSQFRLTLPIKA